MVAWREVTVRRTVVVGVAIAMVACSESPEATPAGVEITDSAGTRIVASPPRDAVYAELAAEPALSIGLLDGPEELLFGDIESVARDAAGNLIVADDQALEIRIFDPEGGYLRSLGGEGEAPGEFSALRGAWPLADDAILALDPLVDRITRFGAEGATVSTATLSSPDDLLVLPIGLGGAAAVLSSATSFSVPSSGSLAGSLEDVMESMFGRDRERVFFLRHGFDGILLDTLAEGINPPLAVSSTGSGTDMQVQMGPVPFAPRPLAAGSTHGVAFTNGATYEVRVFDQAGGLRLIARLDEAPPVRTDEHLETWVRNPGGRQRDEAWVRERLERYRSVELPASLPAYTLVLFADTGDLWAQRYRMRGEPMGRWDVFAADGIHLGRVDVPASLRIQEVSRGQVVGIATDEFGVERVEVRDLSFK